ncbi:hypothetical protein [Actinomadura darangshiensis]|uniref:hypothetical protein n=1 Tax=Actinomadura darangshiensis TaxID=705336 RepID=UPI00140D9399|nr:hypothetical protein [Actinomadura darangshiensis]
MQTALARFGEHGLLFEESGGCISLVAVDTEHDPEPEPPATAPHRVLLDLKPVSRSSP